MVATVDEGQTATYNSQGAVTGIGSTTYTAMGQGNTLQLTRSANTTAYLNTPLGLSAEGFDGPTGASRAFTRDSDGDATSVRLAGGSRYYYAKDTLGSVVGLFDKAGAYLGGYSYSPYGEARATGTNTAVSTNNNLRYIAGYYDTASGLYKLRSRMYDPSLGRFTQYDPSGQESNPYGYASCNPVNASDPTGNGPSGLPTLGGLGLTALGLGTSIGTLATATTIAATGFGAAVLGVIVGFGALAYGINAAIGEC